ncbi:uncharacterized protein LOC110220016 isoform X3 [Phascolarctos cinereus]|uniref:Uncharacterized protein LOC110220016 isoform X3 n=1 Tax=Phascolarctos cinereus TaxID=38626 RepID=A0A6P5LTX9_PHACI|nr:uncharacterized protein LOC110220016 isoform X3 [Phascolarctos cinereus]
MDVTPEISASPKNDIASANSTALRYGSSIMILQNEGSKGDFQITGSTETLFRIPITIWDESRFVLRAWALSISALAFLLLLSLADGRLAIIEVSAIHTEVLGYFTNCQRHTCPKLDKVTVSKHLGMGFMILALATETFCLFFMGFSFRPIFRRINRCDLVFGILNYTTGVLIFLSMLLFSIECWNLHFDKVTFVPPYYLCWASSLILILSGFPPRPRSPAR